MDSFEPADLTLCASSRFYSQVGTAATTLRDRGYSVYTPRLDFNETHVAATPEQKYELTHEFLRKVAASTSIYIINPGGYVGMNVAIEAGFAFALGKTVYAVDSPAEEAVAALVHATSTPDQLNLGS